MNKFGNEELIAVDKVCSGGNESQETGNNDNSVFAMIILCSLGVCSLLLLRVWLDQNTYCTS